MTAMQTAREASPFPDGLLPPVVPRDVSGVWRLVHWITQSTYNEYEGLEIVFDVTLHQAEPIGNTPTPIWGEGRKIRVAGLPAHGEECSNLKLEGDLSGKALRLTLHEYVPGRERVVAGEINLIVSSPWLMRGSFQTNAASAKGVSIAMREAPVIPLTVALD